MFRSIRILALHFEQIPQHRVRSFVWFILSIFNPLVLLAFWRGAITDTATYNLLQSYFFLLIIAGSTLISHIEENVSGVDIQQGELVKYLLRPFPYYWIKFFEEIHFRILQGGYGVILLIIVTVIFGPLISLTNNPSIFLLAICMWILAFFISFTFKMILGMFAFWFTEIYSFFDFSEMVTIIFAGFMIPLEFLPPWLNTLTRFLPFPYMIYFPVKTLQGAFELPQILQLIGIQFFWLAGLILIYRKLWQSGIKKFTAVGQ